MTKFLLTLIGLAILTVLIVQDTWRLTLNTEGYEISVSFVLFVVMLFVLLWLIRLLKKPLGWITNYREWNKTRNQAKKDAFISELLTTLLSHQTEKKQELLGKAKKMYGANSQEVLLISALLDPTADIFQTLNENQGTKVAGLYGLIENAEKNGDFDEMARLLNEVPGPAQKTQWVRQAKWRLAVARNDWTEAMRLLEEYKKYLPKAVYKSHRSALLVKLGKAKEAYELNPNNPAIALIYAEVAPKKARSILEKAWNKTPCWPVYLAYKKTLQGLPTEKQVKAILALTKSTRDERYSLLARADMDYDIQNWARAKENLEIYLQNYPLTRQVANMMAAIERNGWRHEDAAMEWEGKAIESEDDSLWMCSQCGHTAGEWHVLCPHCNAFDSLYIK